MDKRDRGEPEFTSSYEQQLSGKSSDYCAQVLQTEAQRLTILIWWQMFNGF